jgi:hypothetical protein
VVCVVRKVILRSSFKDVCDVCGFPANICEIGPFLGGVGGCG